MGKKEIKYAKAIEELNKILDDLQSERIDVDEVAVKVKKAMELIRICKDKISSTELEVKKVIKEFEKEIKEET